MYICMFKITLISKLLVECKNSKHASKQFKKIIKQSIDIITRWKENDSLLVFTLVEVILQAWFMKEYVL